MLIRCISAVLIAGSMFFLPGCATKPAGAAAQSEYQAPAAGADVATLKGTRRRIGFLADDHYGYILLIDRKFITNGRKGWNKPISLAPGRHTITAEYVFGPYMARADLVVDAVAGATYQLMIMNGTEGGPEGARFNDFWIVDSTGKVVSQVAHASVSGGTTYNPFSVN